MRTNKYWLNKFFNDIPNIPLKYLTFIFINKNFLNNLFIYFKYRSSNFEDAKKRNILIIDRCIAYGKRIGERFNEELNELNQRYDNSLNLSKEKNILYNISPIDTVLQVNKKRYKPGNEIYIRIKTFGGFGEHNSVLYYKRSIDNECIEVESKINNRGDIYFRVMPKVRGTLTLYALVRDENGNRQESNHISIYYG